jgi:predicted NBD/HSP70 family sugar kinase
VGQQTDLRRRNLGLILREVHLNGPLSRAELSDRLGIDSSTVRLIVHDLVGLGLVVEPAPTDTVGPGRPPRLVSLSDSGPLALALEVATDSLAVAVVGFGGKVHSRSRAVRVRRAEDPASVVEGLARLARPLIEDEGIRRRVVAVGVSTPGSVRAEDGFVGVAVNLGWKDVPLADLVAASLGLGVPVRVGNDAQMATLAESLRGAGAGCPDFICVWAESGIGAGVIAAGRALIGSHGYGGRLGHVPISHEDHLCNCGSRRCLETVAGENALLRLAGRSAGGGGPDEVDAILSAARQASPKARLAMEEVGRWLGLGLATLVELFNPSRIALAGMYERIFPFIDESVRETLDEPTLSPSRSTVEVVKAALGSDSALIGAAEYALEPFLDDPAVAGERFHAPGRSERAPSKSARATAARAVA